MSEIKCDFDGELPRDLEYRIGRLLDVMDWILDDDKGIEVRRTRRGFHVILNIAGRRAIAETDPAAGSGIIEPWFIVIAQLYLGSDRERELFNAMRVQNWKEVPQFWRNRWNVLYLPDITKRVEP